MQADGRVGPALMSDGALSPFRLSKDGATVVQHGHAKYQEAVLRGNVYFACNTATQALSLASATATGLILTNPFNSGKNLVILNVSSYISAAITAVANVALFAGFYSATSVTQAAPITVRNALIGPVNTNAVGLVASSATLPGAPTHLRSLYGWHWVTGGTETAQLGTSVDIDGSIILSPGTTLSVQGITVAHSAISSFTWEEVPV